MDKSKKRFVLVPGSLSLEDLKSFMQGDVELVLSDSAIADINNSRAFLEESLAAGKKIYGVNTGFGILAKETISEEHLSQLQENIILSHACGVGDYLSPEITRLILILKINSLSMGYSGIRLQTVEQLVELYNNDILPCIPEKGSVGASGDLAPLSHLVAPLLGYGQVYFEDEVIDAKVFLKKTNKTSYKFDSKEGLALINGTQVSTAIAIYALFKIKHLFDSAIYIGALSVDAARGSRKSFDKLISKIRNQPGQITVAARLYELLEGSSIMESHNNKNCDKVQDPYSIRCQPQVMGACLQQIEFAETVLSNEINSVTDNPLIFSKENTVLFGGNFHAEPVGFAADNLALAVAEIGSISERRIALLIDSNFSSLPAFLVNKSGLNSGFMIAHVTAASLVSENKALATPCVVDSIPTSANQEDHVSMATYGARRLITMADNCFNILAIELLAAAQGIEFRRPLKTSDKLEEYLKALRNEVAFYDTDRYMHQDIVRAKTFVESNQGNI